MILQLNHLNFKIMELCKCVRELVHFSKTSTRTLAFKGKIKHRSFFPLTGRSKSKLAGT
jgi:hypothetical protein